MRFLRTLGWMTVISVAVGCGPEQSAMDRQKRELLERVEQDFKTLPELTGVFAGKWTSATGVQFNAVMELELGRELRRVPPSNELLEVPTLVGSIHIYSTDPTNTTPLAEVEAGSYNLETGVVNLDLGESRYFTGTFRNNRLEGRLPVKGRQTSLVANRIKRR